MKCPECGSKTKIIDSREAGNRTVVSQEYKYDGHKVRRRHLCGSCKARFTTIEVLCEVIKPKFPEEHRYKKNKPKTQKPNNDWLEKIKKKLEE